MIKGRRAHGAALATLPTCATYHQTAKQGYTELALCLVNPKPLKWCLRLCFPYCATPKGLANTVGAAHTRVRHVAGVQGKTSCTLTTEALGRLQPVKAKPLRGCFASLDRFPAPSASVSLLPPRRWRGVKGDEVVHFTLDALESTQHSP